MNRIVAFCLLITVLLGCGGGGAISSIRISGRVLDISTGGPTTNPSTVQSSTSVAQTAVVDGSFLIGAGKAETKLIVSAPSLLGYPVFTYDFQPLNQTQNDVGDLWVGPQQVTVTGTVQNAADNSPIANALVHFGGQIATTDATGTFNVLKVAYSATNTSGFLGLSGQVSAANFLSNQFTPGGNTAVSGVVNVGVVLMSPVGSNTPPPPPFNLWGLIAPSNLANGTIVTLKNSIGTPVRRFTVGIDARYQFWVQAGTYSIDFANGTHTAPTQNVTLSNTTDVIRKDATLN
jgi:hypothetical protein